MLAAAAVHSHVMVRAESANEAAVGPLRYGSPYDVVSRLRRSATIALLISPAGLLLLSIARLLIVADYNPTTALAIVSSGGYVDSLLGSLLPLIPIFLPYMALGLLFLNRVILGSIALLGTVFISPVAIGRTAVVKLASNDWHQIFRGSALSLVIMAILALIVGILLIVQIIDPRNLMRSLGVLMSILLIPLVVSSYPFPFSHDFYLKMIRQPWLPAETVTLQTGQKVTGYVLSDTGSWVVVLESASRKIVYYPAADVTALQVCQVGTQPPTQPLVTLISAPPRTSPNAPACEVAPPQIPPTPSKPAHQFATPGYGGPLPATMTGGAP